MKVLIADDHWLIRDSLKLAVKSLGFDLEIIEAGSFAEAMELLHLHPNIDLMLIDLVMPGPSGFEGLRSVRKGFPDIPVAVISVHEDREHIIQAIKEGVIGYIPKSAEGSELLRGLTLVLNGGVYFPREILQNTRPGEGNPVGIAAVPAATRNGKIRQRAGVAAGRDPSHLTEREHNVFELLQTGRTNDEIAAELSMSRNTVRVHLRNIGIKLKLKDRAGIAAFGK